jgi:6-phosphogluconate dehydrogenase
VKIGADICEQKDKKAHHVLGDVQDKVVQDIDGTEGTGIWSNTQAENLHIPAPTLSTAHFLRIASAFRGNREHVKETFHGAFLPSKFNFAESKEKEAFLEHLRWAVYSTCLAAYIQGISIINKADKKNKWSIDFAAIVQIWKAGCISSLLEEIFHPVSGGKHKNYNLLYESKIVEELKKGYESLKKVVLKSVETNAIVPSMSATLEYLKYSGNLKLPTQFYEAELDYFGKHMYDSKTLDKGPGKPETGEETFRVEASIDQLEMLCVCTYLHFHYQPTRPSSVFFAGLSYFL